MKNLCFNHFKKCGEREVIRWVGRVKVDFFPLNIFIPLLKKKITKSYFFCSVFDKNVVKIGSKCAINPEIPF